MKIALKILLVMSLFFAVVAQDSPISKENIEKFSKLISERAIDRAEVFETNGFRVESMHVNELGGDFMPTGKEMDQLHVVADGLFRTVIEKGRESPASGGVIIFHRKSGMPILSIGDQNGDGFMDSFTYSVFDEEGELILDYVDYEADGQPDVRIFFKEDRAEIWHADKWFRIEKRDGKRGITVNEQFIGLESKNNQLRVP